MSSILGTHDIDIFSISGGPEVATFGNQNPGVQLRFYDQYSQNGVGGYLMGMNNSNFWLIKDLNSNVQVGIGTTLPNPGAALQVQGTLLTSNIGTYNANSNIYFNNQSIYGVSNVIFTGSLINAGNNSSFVTSQWNTTTNNDIQFGGNVAIGATTVTTFGTACNLLVVGNMLVTGNVTANNYVNQNAVLGVYSSATFYNPSGDGSQTILTNDPITSNCILFSFTLNPGRYIITSTVPYQNLTPMMAIDTANWGTVGLYQATPQTLTRSTVPLRFSQLSAIGSYITTDLEAITFSWFFDTTTINQANYVIAVFGKGHQLKFGPSGYSFPTPTVYNVPMRGIGYDDVISVRQALQINPARYTAKLSGTLSPNSVNVSGIGYLTAVGSNVDFYYNGTKKNYLTDYTVTSTFNGTSTVWTVAPQTFTPQSGDSIDVLVWPQVNPANSSFYSSGFLYQQINTSTTPWMNVIGGGVRLGSRCVIDGDLFVNGNIWGGCNTTGFASGVQYTGTAPINTAAGVIGTTNLANGAVTAAKLNLANSTVTMGNIGIGTTAVNPYYNMECYGGSHFAGGVTLDSYIQTPLINVGFNGLQVNISSGPTNAFFINGSGNGSNFGYVGIGTSAPASNLHVFGNALIQSIYGSNALRTDIGGNVTIGGNLNATSNIIVSGSITTNSNVIVGGSLSAPNMNMYRNRVINGDMRISQRNGSSFYNITTNNTNVYVLDRFYTSQPSSQLQVAQNALTTADTPYISGFRYSLQVTVSTAITSGNILGISQAIEGYNINDFNWGVAGAVVTNATLSFWIKAYVTVATNVGVSVAFTGTATPAYYTTYVAIPAASFAWQYVTINIPPPPTGTLANTTNTAAVTINIGNWTSGTTSASVGWNTTSLYYAAGNWANTIGNYISVTGVQFEKGLVATPFEFRPFTQELMYCQRYYETSVDYGSIPGSAAVTLANGAFYYPTVYAATNLSYGTIQYKVPKRATAGTVSTYTPSGTTAGQCTFNYGTTSGTQTVTIANTTINGFNYTIPLAQTGVAQMSWGVASEL